MNPVTDILFTIIWFSLLFFAIRSLIRGWSIMREVPSQGYIVEKKTVTKIAHPEMADVKQGDELLVVRFDEPEKEKDPRFKLDSPELHNLGDPLHKSLQDRIEELQDNDDDDDDDDGGLIVRS